MAESIGNTPPKDIEKNTQEEDDAERLAAYLIMHPDQPIPKIEDETNDAKFNRLVAEFENKYDLEELSAIEELSHDLMIMFQFADELSVPGHIERMLDTYRRHNPSYVSIYQAKIDSVRAIVLTSGDTRKFEIRTAAKKDLILIHDIGGRKEEYLRLSRAVGIISGNCVRHDIERRHI
jgi:hypothetical protein